MTEIIGLLKSNNKKVYDVTLANGVSSIATNMSRIDKIDVFPQNGSTRAGGEMLLEHFRHEGDASALVNVSRPDDMLLTEYKIDGNLATGTVLAGFTAPFDGQITRVEYSVATAGTTGSSLIDVNIAGTTIFTTQNNRPTLATGATTLLNVARVIEAGTFTALQRITIDVDQTCTTPEVDPVIRVYGRYKPYYQCDGEITRVVLSAATTGNDSLTAGGSYAYMHTYDLSGTAFTDETTPIGEATDNDVELYAAAPAVGDINYYGCEVPFDKLTLVQGTDAVWDVVSTWYISTSATEADWEEITVTDGSAEYTDVNGTTITWTIPHNWVEDTINSQAGYWVKQVLTTVTAITTPPQLASADFGLAAVVDVNVAGTTVYTAQGKRAVLHDGTTNATYEVEGSRKLVNAVTVDSSGIAAGSFTRSQLISADIDYAAPSTGTEPVDFEIFVYGAMDNSAHREQYDWSYNASTKKLIVSSDNLKSTTPVRVIAQGIP